MTVGHKFIFVAPLRPQSVYILSVQIYRFRLPITGLVTLRNGRPRILRQIIFTDPKGTDTSQKIPRYV